MKPIKILFIGDVNVGKTSFLITYQTKNFPENYIPIGHDSYVCNVALQNKQVLCNLWDINYSEYDNLRMLSYPNTDVFVLCYSVANRSSFENILLKWFPEIATHSPKVPIILVGTKTDLRDNVANKRLSNPDNIVSTAEGKKMQTRIKAKHFFECSSKDISNIDVILENTVYIAVDSRLCCLRRRCNIQ